MPLGSAPENPFKREELKPLEPSYIDVTETVIAGQIHTKVDIGIAGPGCAFRSKIEDAENPSPCANFCRWPEMARESFEAIGRPENALLRQALGALPAIKAVTTEGQPVVVNLYTAGSVFNPLEFPFNEVEAAIRAVAEIDGVTRVSVEGRAPEIHAKRSVLSQLEALADETRVEIVVAMGVETFNPEIRKNVHKHSSRASIDGGLNAVLQTEGLIPQVYLLAKPTVMSEGAALKQALDDLRQLEQLSRDHSPETGKKKIYVNLSPIFPMEGTGAALNEAYEPVSLWLLLEVLRNLRDDPEFAETLRHLDLFINLSDEGGNVFKPVTSCPDSEDAIKAVIKKFNSTQDLSVLDELPDYESRNTWLAKVEADEIPVGTLHYHPEKGNRLSWTTSETQIRGIVNVEQSSFGEIAVNEETLRQRIEAGHHFSIAYDPNTGSVIGYCACKALTPTELYKIPEDQRHWGRLMQVSHHAGGSIWHGYSIGVLEEAPNGTGRQLLEHVLSQAREAGASEVIGDARMTGLRDFKERVEKLMEGSIERPHGPDRVEALARAYYGAHMRCIQDEVNRGTLGETKALKVLVELPHEAPDLPASLKVTVSMDPGLAFHGRAVAGFGRPPQPNHLVKDYEHNDPTSLDYGVALSYPTTRSRS